MDWWNNLTKREKVLLVLLLIIILGVGYFYVYRGQMKELTQTKAQIDKVMSEIKQKMQLVKQKAATKQNIQQLQKRLKQGEAFLTEAKLVDLIVSLNQAARNKNITLLSLKPASVNKDNQYLKFPISIEAVGNYQNIIDYLEFIKTNKQLVRVINFNIYLSQAVANQVKIELQLVGYGLAGKQGG